MDEAETGALGSVRFGPVAAGRFEQAERADDIGLDKGRRSRDGPVDMGLRREMDHSVGFELAEEGLDCRPIADVGMHEAVAGMSGDIAQGFERARIGELVDIENGIVACADQKPAHG